VKKLTLHAVEAVDELAWPENHHEYTLHSSALDVFTDFKSIKPLVIEASSSAVEVERLMKKAHVRLKIVIDKNQHFIGLVSYNSLNSQEMVKKLVKGESRENLMVTDFMIPKSKLKAIAYTDIANAKIGDVIETLKVAGQQHCLVIDRKDHTIRGVLSANDIAKKLHLAIDVSTPTSFASIFEAISPIPQPLVV
jgi:CBS domain containing-hemolysin-like protein